MIISSYDRVPSEERKKLDELERLFDQRISESLNSPKNIRKLAKREAESRMFFEEVRRDQRRCLPQNILIGRERGE